MVTIYPRLWLLVLLRAEWAQGLPVIGQAKSPLAVANGLIGECWSLVDAGTRNQLDLLLNA